MERNVGGVDRLVRGAVGVVLLVVATVAYRSRKRSRAVITAIAGLGLLFNAVTCFCGGNYVFGIDTTADATSDDATLEE